MAGNVSNSLSFNLVSTDDTTQNVPINYSLSDDFDCSTCDLTRYFNLAAGANVIALPKSPATQVFIRNVDPAKTITVAWTPNGGASNNVIVLNVGDVIMFWCDPAGATTPGVTAISLTPSAANCLVEFFIGG